jgi:hypothetical protein
MKISDLASLVTVRNHILTVMGDKSATTKEDFKPLNQARIKLDKRFVEIVKEIDVDDLFPNDLLIVKVGDDNYPPTKKDLEAWRTLFEVAAKDKDFKIFTHNKVSIQRYEISPNAEFRVEPGIEELPAEMAKQWVKTNAVNKSIVDDLNNKITATQLLLPLDIEPKPTEGVWDDSIDSGSPQTLGAEPSTLYGIKTIKEPKPEVDEAAIAEEQASFVKRIQEQKELLKKQGRSNKKISSGKKSE